MRVWGGLFNQRWMTIVAPQREEAGERKEKRRHVLHASFSFWFGRWMDGLMDAWMVRCHDRYYCHEPFEIRYFRNASLKEVAGMIRDPTLRLREVCVCVIGGPTVIRQRVRRDTMDRIDDHSHSSCCCCCRVVGLLSSLQLLA